MQSITRAVTPPATRWRASQFRPSPTLYLDAVAGQGVTDNGVPFTCSPGANLREIVDMLPAEIERMYLCGQLPSAPQASRAYGGMYSPFNSWVVEARPDRLRLESGAEHDATFAVLPRSDGGRPVELRSIASWLSTLDCTPDEARTALALVLGQIQRTPGWEKPPLPLLATPARLGLELWRRSIGYEKEYPYLGEELRSLIHRTSGQGRFEVFPCPTADGMLPELHCLDGRWMYAAPCRDELGIGPAIHDFRPDYAGFVPARYRVRYVVPTGWTHVGLFMTPDPASEPGSRTRHFPSRPGASGETWVDASELRIAYWPFPHQCSPCQRGYHFNNLDVQPPCPEHGWHVTILERIVFTKGRPLETWANKLTNMRETVAACPPDSRIVELARAAVRNVLIHTIGAFHGTHWPTTRITSAEDARSGVPLDLALTAEGEELYLEHEEHRAPIFPDYDRPEWSAQVWGRARARLLLHRDATGTFTGALTLPVQQLVALRLDAIYTTADPDWPDDGTVGRFREKWALHRSAPWPLEETDLTALKHQADEEHAL